MKFCKIPAGEFMMGDAYEGLHKVTISQSFYLGMYEVTQGQWGAVMRNNPSKFQTRLQYPLESVSWQDCQNFIARLNGSARRIPTLGDCMI